jgi:hypothetical protein
LAVQVLISPSAQDIIPQGGGELYMWEQTWGNSELWAVDRAALTRPDGGVFFVAHHVDGGLRILIDERLEPPNDLRIRRNALRRRRLVIWWDGKRWGWRGDNPAPGPQG